MSIHDRLRNILNEGIEDDRYTQAIHRELSEEYDVVVNNINTDKPEETDVIQTIGEKLKEFAKDDTVKSTHPYIISLIKDKINSGEPIDRIIHYIKTKYNIPSDVQGAIESQLKGSNDTSVKTNSLITQAQELAECVMGQIALVFKPSGGIEDQRFTDRSREHVNRYISRVNGNNVEINQALNEMKALFNIDEELSNHMTNVFKVAKGVLDENTLKFIKENIGGTTVADDTTVEPMTITETPKNEISSVIEPDTVDDTTPTFFTEYKKLFEDISNIAESMTGTLNEGADYSNILETLSSAATTTMKQGALGGNGYQELVERILNIIKEEYKLTEEQHTSISNALRQAGDIGKYYTEEFLKNKHLYDDRKSVDMTVSLTELVDMFGEDDSEDVLDIMNDSDIMEPEVTEDVIPSLNELYMKKINNIFDK